MSVLAIALASSPALASPLGNPGRTPESGVIEFQLQLGQSFQTIDDTDLLSCTENCSAVDWVRGPAGRVNLRPASFLGLWGEATWATDILDGTDHAARGLGYAGGANLTLPVRGPRPALAAEATWLSTEAGDGEGGVASDNTAFTLEAAALLVVGDDDGGANLWLGPIGTVMSTHQANLFYAVDEAGEPDPLRLDLAPRRPLGAVLGGEMISAPLGQYLRARSPRMAFGAEVRVWDAWGAAGWMGVAF